MFVNVGKLRYRFRSIASLATVGVMVSAMVVGVLLWVGASWVGITLPFVWCALFGALISPTDPIAALSVVRQSGASPEVEIKLVGESLFNDATGVMFFLVILEVIATGSLAPWTLSYELLIAPVFGAGLGLVLGIVATEAISRVNHHPTEVLITLALAAGSYGLAEALHLSAPIAVVVAGMVIGWRARQHAMTPETREHLDVFWAGLDEIINAALFVLIGLALLIVDMSWSILLLGLLAWLFVLAGRWVGVALALSPFRGSAGLGREAMPVLVWGGLRGGISLALSLSLPPSKEASILVAITFVVVVLSSTMQGLTLRRVMTRYASRRASAVPSVAPPLEPDA
jgi:CPA1 family monovalent cation:H+ antiporter